MVAHMMFDDLPTGAALRLEEIFDDLVRIPRGLIAAWRFDCAHWSLPVTTNLAVGRYVVANDLLNAADCRDRIDIIETLNGTVQATDKLAQFLKHALLFVLDRYEIEPQAAVRDRIEILIEGACVAAQVRAKIYFKYHHHDLERYIRRLIDNGIKLVFDRARLAECLWALDRRDEADVEVKALLATGLERPKQISCVYAHRIMYSRWEPVVSGSQLRNL